MGKGIPFGDEDNVLAALEDSNRVCLLYLHIRAPHLEKLATVIRQPFPALTKLQLSLKGRHEPILQVPSGFLGGSAPCLQELYLNAIPFQELPTLLLSAPDLVTLHLGSIPPTGYISPEAMVACLAALTSLRSLHIDFQSTTSRPDRTDPATGTRTVLPALTYFEFSGVCDYVEDLVARIDCPRLNGIDLSYLDPSVDFRVSQVFKFINRSEDPQLTLFSGIDVSPHPFPSQITLRLSHEYPYHIVIFISLIGCDWGLSHVAQVFGQLSAKLSNVRHLSIGSREQGPEIGHTEWVQLLYPFTTMQALYVFGGCVGHVALALEGVDGEMTTELLPALDLLCLKDQPVSSIAEFCAARQLSGRPVTFVRTRREFDERLKSYLSK